MEENKPQKDQDKVNHKFTTEESNCIPMLENTIVNLNGQELKKSELMISGMTISDKWISQRLKTTKVPVTELCGELITELERHGFMERLRTIPHYRK